MPSVSQVHFCGFALDLETGEIRRGSRKIKLAPQPFRVLALLAASPGQLVTRETIQQELWGHDTLLDSEHALNSCIREIRTVLGENAKKPRFIETLPRRGYRFIAPAPSPTDLLRRQRETPATNESKQLEAYQRYSRARKALMQVGKDALEEARQDFEGAVALDPAYALAHSGLGATYALRSLNRRLPEDLDKALSHLQRALELDMELAEPYPWLCYVHIRKSQLDRALAVGHRAVELQPDLVHAHYFLGLAYFAASEADPKHYQNAAKYLSQATQVGPTWQANWFVLSYIALLNGDYGNAEAFARRLMNMATSNTGLPFIGAEITLATVELRRGNRKGARSLALEFLEKLVGSDHMYKDSMSAVAACILGDTALRDGELAGALAAYRRAWHAVQEHPRIMAYQRICARIQAGLSAAYAATAEPKRAAELVEQAVRTAADSELPEHNAAAASQPELYFAIAVAYLRANDKRRALVNLRRAVATGWGDSQWCLSDPELRPLDGQTEFLEIIDDIRRMPKITFQPV